MNILFPAELSSWHRDVIFRYLEDPARLSAQDWVLVIGAFNLLKRAVVVLNVETTFTFARIYRPPLTHGRISRRQPPEIEARVIDDELVLAAPPDGPVRVEGNRIRWEDGQEVVIRLAG